MAVSLLASKLFVPPARPELVPRPRLTEQLNAGLEQDGRFVRQLKTRADGMDFSYLRSIFVDELTGKLFLLDNHSLHVANIPPLEFE